MLTIFLPPKRQVVGELGWTAQIIFDQSGKVPAFWRPPYAPLLPLPLVSPCSSLLTCLGRAFSPAFLLFALGTETLT